MTNQQTQETKEIDIEKFTGEQLEKHINQWRKDMIKDFNENYSGKNIFDNTVQASIMKGLISDVQVLMQWCELLAIKIKELEKNKNLYI